jgi:hypothetical protein
MSCFQQIILWFLISLNLNILPDKLLKLITQASSYARISLMLNPHDEKTSQRIILSKTALAIDE